MTWEEFHSQVGCKVGFASDLVYRVLVQDTQSALESSVFKPLFRSSHWMGVMGAAWQGFQQQTDIEVEVRRFVS
jgi:hypothetical protein